MAVDLTAEVIVKGFVKIENQLPAKRYVGRITCRRPETGEIYKDEEITTDENGHFKFNAIIPVKDWSFEWGGTDEEWVPTTEVTMVWYETQWTFPWTKTWVHTGGTITKDVEYLTEYTPANPVWLRSKHISEDDGSIDPTDQDVIIDPIGYDNPVYPGTSITTVTQQTDWAKIAKWLIVGGAVLVAVVAIAKFAIGSKSIIIPDFGKRGSNGDE